MIPPVRVLVLAITLMVGSLGIAGCHQPADVTCEFFKAHTTDVVVYSAWQDLPDTLPNYDRGRYTCVSWHGGNPASQEYYCVYAPEHQSPPDNVYSVNRSCNFDP